MFSSKTTPRPTLRAGQETRDESASRLGLDAAAYEIAKALNFPLGDLVITEQGYGNAAGVRVVKRDDVDAWAAAIVRLAARLR